MRDIELAGFVVTAEEWASMDPTQRAQLLRASVRNEPWFPPAPPLPAPRRAALASPGAHLAPRSDPGRPLLPADPAADDADDAELHHGGWYATYELTD